MTRRTDMQTLRKFFSWKSIWFHDTFYNSIVLRDLSINTFLSGIFRRLGILSGYIYIRSTIFNISVIETELFFVKPRRSIKHFFLESTFYRFFFKYKVLLYSRIESRATEKSSIHSSVGTKLIVPTKNIDSLESIKTEVIDDFKEDTYSELYTNQVYVFDEVCYNFCTNLWSLLSRASVSMIRLWTRIFCMSFTFDIQLQFDILFYKSISIYTPKYLIYSYIYDKIFQLNTMLDCFNAIVSLHKEVRKIRKRRRDLRKRKIFVKYTPSNTPKTNTVQNKKKYNSLYKII